MSKYIIDWDSAYVRSCRHENAERYGDGMYCVYFWEDEYGDVFYVGSGKGYRFNSISARSDDFMQQYSNRTNPHPRIAAYGMDKEQSLLFESRLTEAFLKQGFPLVNKDCIPRTVTYKGRTRTYGAWGKDIGVTGGTIKARIEHLGWPIEKALFTPSTQDILHQQMERRRLEKTI